MVAQFVSPNEANMDGYDFQQGALWRVRIPVGTMRKIMLSEGAGLKVLSNNSAVVLNSKAE
jgi:hypothetical protein